MKFEQRLRRLEELERHYHEREEDNRPPGSHPDQADALSDEEVFAEVPSAMRNNLLGFFGWAGLPVLT